MIALIDYGAGNLHSVQHALDYIGCESCITSDAKVLMEADAAILPGVGSFGHAMECLQNANLVQPVLDFIHSGKPFLGICLGLQLLFEESEESPGVKGISRQNSADSRRLGFKSASHWLEFIGYQTK